MLLSNIPNDKAYGYRERVSLSNGRRDTKATIIVARYQYAKSGIQRTTSQVDESLCPGRTFLYGQWLSAGLLDCAGSYTRQCCPGSMARPGRSDYRRH